MGLNVLHGIDTSFVKYAPRPLCISIGKRQTVPVKTRLFFISRHSRTGETRPAAPFCAVPTQKQ